MKIADKFVVPMSYSHFGYTFLEDMGGGNLHLGCDLNWGKPYDDDGKQVNATASGEVVYSKQSTSSRGWGNLIIIKHQLEDGKVIYTRYAHLKERWIAEGQEVDYDQGIGTCGNTGTTYPHLHWDAFIEKYVKDGNSLTSYPKSWTARKLRQYYFDPLLFVKNFKEGEDEQNKINDLENKVESLTEELARIRLELNDERDAKRDLEIERDNLQKEKDQARKELVAVNFDKEKLEKDAEKFNKEIERLSQRLDDREGELKAVRASLKACTSLEIKDMTWPNIIAGALKKLLNKGNNK